MELDIIIAIDDTHPEPNWGCEGDQSVEYLKELNKAPNKVIVAPLLINNCNGTPCTIFSF